MRGRDLRSRFTSATHTYHQALYTSSGPVCPDLLIIPHCGTATRGRDHPSRTLCFFSQNWSLFLLGKSPNHPETSSGHAGVPIYYAAPVTQCQNREGFDLRRLVKPVIGAVTLNIGIPQPTDPLTLVSIELWYIGLDIKQRRSVDDIEPFNCQRVA